jgi:GT2 family glycosyltransferase
MRTLGLAREVWRQHSTDLLQTVLRTWSKHGWRELVARTIDAFRRRPIDGFYSEWVRRYDKLTEQARNKMRAEIAGWPVGPRISIVMSIRNDDSRRLAAAIQSVRAQLYPHWELCISVEVSTSQSTRKEIAGIAQRDGDARIRLREATGGSTANLNSALSLARGELVVFLGTEDVLPEHALYWVVKELLAHPEADLIFSDEDRIDAEGNRFAVRFKPAWNPALMLSTNGFGRLGVFRKRLVEKVGDFRPGFDGSEEQDLVLRCARTTEPERIRHIARVLYHRRDVRSPAGDDTEAAAWDAGRRAIEGHLAATGARATVARSAHGSYQVNYESPSPAPRISVLIPTTGAERLLEPCLQSITTLTSYENFEILLLVNERHHKEPEKIGLWDRLAATPRVRLLSYADHPFNYSWVNNWGAGQASGELLCFLNDDTIVITPQWLERLAARVVQPGIAAAGPLLLYPDDTIQHAGVILGLSGIAGHACHRQPRGSCGYLGRCCLEQDVSCSTAACLMIRKAVFQELRGFDEALPIAFNDVDFCIRLRAAGWRIVWTPTVELYHHESASVGRHDSPARGDEFPAAVALMRKRWGAVLDSDPFYNPNLSLRRGFNLAFPPRL